MTAQNMKSLLPSLVMSPPPSLSQTITITTKSKQQGRTITVTPFAVLTTLHPIHKYNIFNTFLCTLLYKQFQTIKRLVS